MSKKAIVICCFFVHLFSISSGQTVKWSQPLENNKKVPYLVILGQNEEENFFVLRSNKSLESDNVHSGFRSRNYQIQYFSSGMNLIWEKELKSSYEDGHISDVKMINGKVVVTSYLNDKKSKRFYFYIQYFNTNGTWSGQPVLLDSFPSDNFDEGEKPGLLNSHDQSLIAFTYRKIFKDVNSQVCSATVLDTNLTIQYKKEIEIPVKEQMYVPVNYLLTNRGSFFVLGIHYTTEKKVKEPDQSYYELYGYNRLLNRPVTAAIRGENRFLTDVEMTSDNINNSIIVAGFYSDKTTYSIAGVFYYSLTEDSLKETKTIHTPFSAAYLQKFLGEPKENRELVNYSIDRLFVRKDGGVAIIAESVYKTSRSYFDYYMQAYISHVYYHYGNIMLLSINPDGNILWNNVITKDQNSIDDEGLFSSYFSAVSGGQLAVAYNKYVEDDSSVLLTTIGSTGAQKTDVLFNELDKIKVVGQSAKQVSDDTVILPAFRQDKFYILSISF
jgi:hypothetical protein